MLFKASKSQATSLSCTLYRIKSREQWVQNHTESLTDLGQGCSTLSCTVTTAVSVKEKITRKLHKLTLSKENF